MHDGRDPSEIYSWHRVSGTMPPRNIQLSPSTTPVSNMYDLYYRHLGKHYDKAKEHVGRHYAKAREHVAGHYSSARNHVTRHYGTARNHLSGRYDTLLKDDRYKAAVKHLGTHARHYKAAGALAALAAAGYGAHRVYKRRASAKKTTTRSANTRNTKKTTNAAAKKNAVAKKNAAAKKKNAAARNTLNALNVHCSGKKKAGTVCNPKSGKYVKKDGPTGKMVIAKYGH